MDETKQVFVSVLVSLSMRRACGVSGLGGGRYAMLRWAQPSRAHAHTTARFSACGGLLGSVRPAHVLCLGAAPRLVPSPLRPLCAVWCALRSDRAAPTSLTLCAAVCHARGGRSGQ